MRRLLVLLLFCTPALAGDYALLINGGYNDLGGGWNNHGVFATACAYMHNELEALGWSVTVLDGNGATNTIGLYSAASLPDPALSEGWGDAVFAEASTYDGEPYEIWQRRFVSPDDYNRDGIGDVDGPGTAEAIYGAFADLAGRMTTQDRLLVEFVDHGGTDEQGWTFGTWGHITVSGSELAAAMDLIPCASRTILVSTCYAGAAWPHFNNAKTTMLGVNPVLIEKYGAVSAEVAEAMVTGALAASGAQLALAVTGIAGPEGGTPDKPVGTVWFAFAAAGRGVVSDCKHFEGDRDTVRRQTVSTALTGVLKYLEKSGG